MSIITQVHLTENGLIIFDPKGHSIEISAEDALRLEYLITKVRPRLHQIVEREQTEREREVQA